MSRYRRDVDISRLRDVLAHREFRRLFATRIVGQAGDGMLQAALATFVLFSPERAPTAERVAISFAVLLLPYSVVGPFLGVLIDRWSRRSILVAGNVLRGLITVVIAALLLAGQSGGLLAVVVLCSLGVARFLLTTLGAALPHTVSPTTLVTANALAPTSGTIASAIGGLFGVGVRQAVGGDRGSVVVAALAVLVYAAAAGFARGFGRTTLGPDEPGESVGDVARGLLEGLRALRRHRPAERGIAVVAVHRAAFGALTALAVIILRTIVYPPDLPGPALTGIALVTALAAGGALVAAIVTPAAVRRFGIPRWTTSAMLVAAVAAPFGVVPETLAALLVAAVIIGGAGQAVKVSADTVVQQQIDDDHRGRVFAIYDMSVNVALVAGVTAIAVTTSPGRIPLAVPLGVGVLLLAGAGLAARSAVR